MRRFVFLTLLSTAFALVCPVVGARDEQDGVQVEKMSPLRNLVSEEKMQAEALQQYTALKAQAREKGVLAPDDAALLVHPSQYLVRPFTPEVRKLLATGGQAFGHA